MDEELDILAVNIESIVVDPDFEEVLEHALDVGEKIAAHKFTRAEAREQARDLRDEWDAWDYCGSEMFVTGYTYRVSDSIGLTMDKIPDETTLTNYTGLAFRPTGFSVLAEEDADDNGVAIRQRLFMIGHIVAEEDAVGVESGYGDSIAIPLEHRPLVEFRDITPSRAAAWLDLYHPDMKRAIDLCAESSKDECEFMVYLGRQIFPIDPEASKASRKEQRRNLQAYYRSMLITERVIPYKLRIHGDYEVLDEDNGVLFSVCAPNETEMIVSLSKPKVTVSTDGQQFELRIAGLLAGDQRDESCWSLLPLKTIVSAQSGRQFYQEL